MGAAVVKDSHLVFNNKRYFRGGAESVVLGAYGEKRQPVARSPYLEIQDDIVVGDVEVRTATIATIDFKRSKRGSVEAGARALDTKVQAGFESFASGELQLVKLEIRLGDVLEIVKAAPKIEQALADYGPDARIAHEIWVVMSASMASSVSKAGSLKMSKGGVSGGISLSGSNSSELTLSPGTTYAYLLCWPRWERRTKRLVKFVDDQWGIG